MADKDVGLRIRVQRDLRERFLEVCRDQDKPAAQVLREFMREFVEVNTREKENLTKSATAGISKKKGQGYGNS